MTQLEKYWESKKHKEIPWNQILIGVGLVGVALVYLVGSGLPR